MARNTNLLCMVYAAIYISQLKEILPGICFLPGLIPGVTMNQMFNWKERFVIKSGYINSHMKSTTNFHLQARKLIKTRHYFLFSASPVRPGIAERKFRCSHFSSFWAILGTGNLERHILPAGSDIFNQSFFLITRGMTNQV